MQEAALAHIVALDVSTPGSQAETDLRKQYAAYTVLAATVGVELPPHETAYYEASGVDGQFQRHRTLSEIWEDPASGRLFTTFEGYTGISDEILMAAKAKRDPDTLTEKQCLKHSMAKELEHAGWEEIANLKRNDTFEPVTMKDPRTPA